jgi:hypothetical protein
MQRDFASGDAWQADATRRWLERLSASAEPGVVSVLEGQTRPSFVRAGSDGSLELRMVLLQCNAEVRAERLCLRGQPELANARMDSWAAYLRGQADALGLPVIDTSELTPDEVADALERELYPQRAPHAARSSNS